MAMALAPAVAAEAQTSAGSFDKWVAQINSDFDGFRQRVNLHYDDFLRGEWHPYEPMKGTARYAEPKPDANVAAPGAATQQGTLSRPAMANVTDALAMAVIKETNPQIYDMMTHRLEPAQPDKGTAVAGHSLHLFGTEAVESFDYCGLQLDMPGTEFTLDSNLASPEDFAAQWSRLESEGVAARLAGELGKLAAAMNLNDWLTYTLAEAYIDSKFPVSQAAPRLAAVHQILVNMDYDARIGVDGKGEPWLLLPATTELYGYASLVLDGRKFYLVAPAGEAKDIDGRSVYTCSLPGEAVQGGAFNMEVGPLTIPECPAEYYLANGIITLQGEVNANLFPLLYSYPAMDTEVYARSVLSPQVRHSLVEQVRSQLAQMDETRKADTLLGFMQYAFDYCTDMRQHGFEKPYFIEENLFYPANDSEDRALFYAWLLSEALGLDSQVVSFPGHTAATVHLSTTGHGTGYENDGKLFYISDPTYLGSKTGQQLPSLGDMLPEIECDFNKD